MYRKVRKIVQRSSHTHPVGFPYVNISHYHGAFVTAKEPIRRPSYEGNYIVYSDSCWFFPKRPSSVLGPPPGSHIMSSCLPRLLDTATVSQTSLFWMIL